MIEQLPDLMMKGTKKNDFDVCPACCPVESSK